jgi:transcriptional regulator with XRE-family HTH domain
MRKRDLDALYRAFGDLVRLGRERLDLSQEKLGRLVGLSRTSITNIEKGRHHLVIHQLLAFARALKLPPEALLPSVRLTARDRGGGKTAAGRHEGQTTRPKLKSGNVRLLVL